MAFRVCLIMIPWFFFGTTPRYGFLMSYVSMCCFLNSINLYNVHVCTGGTGGPAAAAGSGGPSAATGSGGPAATSGTSPLWLPPTQDSGSTISHSSSAGNGMSGRRRLQRPIGHSSGGSLPPALFNLPVATFMVNMPAGQGQVHTPMCRANWILTNP